MTAAPRPLVRRRPPGCLAPRPNTVKAPARWRDRDRRGGVFPARLYNNAFRQDPTYDTRHREQRTASPGHLRSSSPLPELAKGKPSPRTRPAVTALPFCPAPRSTAIPSKRRLIDPKLREKRARIFTRQGQPRSRRPPSRGGRIRSQRGPADATKQTSVSILNEANPGAAHEFVVPSPPANVRNPVCHQLPAGRKSLQLRARSGRRLFIEVNPKSRRRSRSACDFGRDVAHVTR